MHRFLGARSSDLPRGGSGRVVSPRYIDQQGRRVDRRMMPRIPSVPSPWDELEAPCPGCGVIPGRLHRAGCDREMCPACGDDLRGCGCST